jgi:hypothetical protein
MLRSSKRQPMTLDVLPPPARQKAPGVAAELFSDPSPHARELENFACVS